MYLGVSNATRCHVLGLIAIAPVYLEVCERLHVTMLAKSAKFIHNILSSTSNHRSFAHQNPTNQLGYVSQHRESLEGRQEQKLPPYTLLLRRTITRISEGPSESLHFHALVACLDPALLSPTADNPLDFTNGTSCLYTPAAFSTHYE